MNDIPKENTSQYLPYDTIHNTVKVLAFEALKLDSDGEAVDYHYTDEDIMNAIMMFNHIVGNRLYHNNYNENTPIEKSIKVSENFGMDMHNLLLRHGIIDTYKYYKK